MERPKHIPVLLSETIELLAIKPDGTYVDCTMGGAGHSLEILKHLKKDGHLYCFEQDDYAIDRGQTTLASSGLTGYTIIPDNFSHLKKELASFGVDHVDGVLYDLGVSSYQFDIGERGFSYNKEAPLDMRMNRNDTLTARDIVNGDSEEELRTILFEYGEERYAREIARKIVREREIKPIETTTELADLVTRSKPARARREAGHPAKQTFQALRIAVNHELEVLETSLADALTLLAPGGRIAVITFQSLEDRVTTRIFKEAIALGLPPSDAPVRACDIHQKFHLVTHKPVQASPEELALNPRSHSARLRVIEKNEEVHHD